MKKVKNFTESVSFMAQALITMNKVPAEFFKLHKQYALTKLEGEEEEALRNKMLSLLPPETVKELDGLGVTSPFSTVSVKVDFSSFLYECYVAGSVRPSAPLALAAHNNRLSKLAERLTNSAEFELDAKELSVVRRALEDDNIWKSVRFSAYVEKEGEETPYQISLNSTGLAFFNQIQDEAVKLFVEGVPVESKPDIKAV